MINKRHAETCVCWKVPKTLSPDDLDGCYAVALPAIHRRGVTKLQEERSTDL